jgi:hypothetical protein
MSIIILKPNNTQVIGEKNYIAVKEREAGVICNFLNRLDSNALFSYDSAMLIHFKNPFITHVDTNCF